MVFLSIKALPIHIHTAYIDTLETDILFGYPLNLSLLLFC